MAGLSSSATAFFLAFCPFVDFGDCRNDCVDHARIYLGKFLAGEIELVV